MVTLGVLLHMCKFPSSILVRPVTSDVGEVGDVRVHYKARATHRVIMKANASSATVEVKTWSRDSHDLYDYENTNTAVVNYEVAVPGQLVRNHDIVRFLTGDETQGSEDVGLVEMIWNQTMCYVKPSRSELWEVVSQMPGRSLRLVKDMQLKLGRVRYTVKEVMVTAGNYEACDTDSSEEETPAPDLTEATCRVCYDKESDRHNPLLSHCKCDGSVKYTHLLCLKQWLRSKVVTKTTDTSITYQWKCLECEICKTELPLTLRDRGMHFSLFDVDRPQSPHLVLESFPSERSATKSMHVIFIETKSEVKLGRGHESDVRINDISVSRLHAIIKYEDGLFRLEDNNSKFGTLVQVLAPLHVVGSVALQAGRSLIRVECKDRAEGLRNGWREVPSS